MKFILRFILLGAFIGLVGESWGQVAGDFRSTGSTNWSLTTTWQRYNGSVWQASGVGANNPGQLPNSASDVFILTGHTVNVNVSNAACKALNASAATSSKISFTTATSILNVYGDLVLNISTNHNLIGTTWTVGAKLVFTGGNAQATVNLTASTIFTNVDVNKSANSLITDGNLRVSTLLNVISGTLISGVTYDIQGTGITSNISIGASGTITQSGGNGVIREGSSAANPLGTLTVNGVLNINTTSGFGINVSLLNIESGGVVNVLAMNNGVITATNGIIIKNGAYFNTLNGVINPSINSATILDLQTGGIMQIATTAYTFPTTYTLSGTVNYYHIGSQTITSAIYTHLTLSGTNLTNNKTPAASPLNVNGNLTITGTAQLIGSSNIINIGGNWTSYGTGGFTESTSTVNFNGSSAQTINTTGGEDFYIVNKSGTGTTTILTDVRLGGGAPSALTISAGILDAGTNTLSGTGSTAFNMNAGTLKLGKLSTTLPEFSISGNYNITGGTIELNGVGNQELSGGRNYVNLTFSGSGIKTVSSSINPPTNTILGTVTVTSTAILDVSNRTFGGAGTNLTVTSGAKYKTAGTSTKPDALGTYLLSPTSTVEFSNIAATQENIRLAPLYGNIIISGSSVGLSGTPSSLSLQSGSTFAVSSTGIFNVQSSTGFTDDPNAAVSSTNNPAIDLQAGSTINYDGATQPLTARSDYKKLTISGSGIKTANGDVTVASTLALTAGELGINGHTLAANGAFTYGTGTLRGSSTSKLIIGGTAGTLNFTQTTASDRSLLNLTLGTSGTAVLGTALDVYGNIQVNNVAADAMDFNAKNVTLKSVVANTATIDKLNPTGSNLIGATNVTVERFIKLRAPGTGTGAAVNGRAYRLLAPTVNTSTSIKFNWMNNEMNNSAYSNVNTNAPYYGTQITGDGGNVSGFDATVTNQSSLYSAGNGLTPSYVAVGNTTSTLDATTGYFLFIRGDRSMDMTLYNTNVAPGWVLLPTSSTTLRATGTILKGQVNSFANPFSGSGELNLVTNPYPAPINWSLLRPDCSNIKDYYTLWDPNIGKRGGFVTVHTSGTTTQTEAGATTASIYIQPGQAFFVESDGGVPIVNIEEVHKAVGNNNNGVFLVEPPPVESFSVALFYRENNNTIRRLADGVTTMYDNNYSASVDGQDAKEIGNWDENIAILREGKKLAIEARPVIISRDTMPLFIANMQVRNYELEFSSRNFSNAFITAKLIDNFTGVPRFLNVTGTTTVPISVTTDPASYASNRFMVVFGPSGGPLPIIVNYFTGAKQNGSHLLNWKVSCQSSPTATMVLERSSDGRSFLAINSITATALRCNDPFSYTDAAPLSGTNYYRLKITDADGKISYSNIVVLTSLVKSMEVLNISPNPVLSGSFTLRINSAANERADIQISDMQGRILQNQQINIVSGMNTIPVNVQKLPAGSYQLKLISGDAEPEMLRFTIQ